METWNGAVRTHGIWRDRAEACDEFSGISGNAGMRMISDMVPRRRSWLDRQPLEFRNSLLALSRPKHYPAGTSIAHMGDAIDDFIGIRRGCVAIHWDGFGRQCYQIQLFWPGDWIGEHALITGRPRKVTAIASTDVEALAVPAGRLQALLENHPAYWQSFADLANEHTTLAIDTLIDRMHPGSLARCAAVLLGLVYRGGVHVVNPEGVTLPITQSDLGTLASLSRNSVGAALKTLRAARLVDAGYRNIRIASVAGLRAYVERLIA